MTSSWLAIHLLKVHGKTRRRFAGGGWHGAQRGHGPRVVSPVGLFLAIIRKGGAP